MVMEMNNTAIDTSFDTVIKWALENLKCEVEDVQESEHYYFNDVRFGGYDGCKRELFCDSNGYSAVYRMFVAYNSK